MSRIAVAVLAAALFGCGADSVTLSDELCGRWVTDDVRYAGRYFELSNESIRFGNDDEELSKFRVIEIRCEDRRGELRYDLTYLDASGAESIFAFEHLWREGCVRISHSPGRKWKKWAPPAEPQLESEPEPEPKSEKKAKNQER